MPSNLRTSVALGVAEIEATPRAQAPSARSRVRACIGWLEARALFVAAVAAVAVVSLTQVYLHISQDSWLALVAGRLIAAHGIPQHDYLTVMAHGVRWVDQQWLAQLGLYELYRVGGLALMSVVYAFTTAASLALAIAAARRLGAAERSLVYILPFGAFFFIATAVSVRTQGFAYPLFALTLWLLASEVRAPSRARVYLVLPVLVLWANLHGSVTMGVGLAVIFGVTSLYEGLRAHGIRGLIQARGLVFTLGSPLALLATPYGTAVVHYYASTLFNSEFGKLVSEWRPVTSVMVLAVPFMLLLLFVVWLLGRSGRRTPAFDQLVLAMLGLGGVFAVRNITWFGLATVILVPAVLQSTMREKAAAPRRTRLNATLAGLSIALVLLSALTTLARPARWFEHTYDLRAVPAVARLVTANPNLRIYADVRFADWLIWHDPALAGHVAYDTSFELLSARQLQTIANIGQAVPRGQTDPLAAYRAFVLDPKNRASNRALLDRPGTRVVLRSKRVIVASSRAR
jgi:hypothetical protein